LNELDSYIEAYVADLRLKGFPVRRQKEAKWLLSPFVRFLLDENLSPVALRYRDAREFKRRLVESSYARGSVNKSLYGARKFMGFLAQTGIVVDNPFYALRTVREGKKVPRNVLSEEDTEKLLTELERFDSGSTLWEKIMGYRAHLVAELQYATGMRLGEVAALRAEDLDFEAHTATVRCDKRGKERVCFLSEYAARILARYVDELRPWVMNKANAGNGTLFGAASGEFCTITNRVLRAAAVRAGVKGITTHGFRHAFGAHLLRAGCDLRLIQELLGHERLKTTQVYTRIEKEDLKRVIDTCHPRQWGGRDAGPNPRDSGT
jgi:site-specific recombinase XerD